MTDEKRLDPVENMDQRAFEGLFREYFSPLMAFAMKFLTDEDNAREVVQGVFIRLWEKREEIDLSNSLKSYLYRSVHNRSLNMIRDRRKFSDGEVPDLAGEVDVSAHMESMELEKKIRESIDGLPVKCREIFELSRYHGMKYSEIAEKLDISLKTVENQMGKALKVLREKLSGYLTILLWLILNSLN